MAGPPGLKFLRNARVSLVTIVFRMFVVAWADRRAGSLIELGAESRGLT